MSSENRKISLNVTLNLFHHQTNFEKISKQVRNDVLKRLFFVLITHYL
jgi:hypothetical protein